MRARAPPHLLGSHPLCGVPLPRLAHYKAVAEARRETGVPYRAQSARPRRGQRHAHSLQRPLHAT